MNPPGSGEYALPGNTKEARASDAVLARSTSSLFAPACARSTAAAIAAPVAFSRLGLRTPEADSVLKSGKRQTEECRAKQKCHRAHTWPRVGCTTRSSSSANQATTCLGEALLPTNGRRYKQYRNHSIQLCVRSCSNCLFLQQPQEAIVHRRRMAEKKNLTGTALHVPRGIARQISRQQKNRSCRHRTFKNGLI